MVAFSRAGVGLPFHDSLKVVSRGELDRFEGLILRGGRYACSLPSTQELRGRSVQGPQGPNGLLVHMRLATR